jgi:signal transduction histidine kinase/ligand-binding sensor domain-containing protein
MKVPQYIRLVPLLLLLAMASSLPAGAQRHHVQTYAKADELLNAMVRDITQDSTGRLWFATRHGVTAYDGVEWVHHDLTRHMKHVDFYKVLVGERNQVWAIPWNWINGIYSYGGDDWQVLPRMPGLDRSGLRVSAAATAPRGGATLLIVAIEGEGAVVWDGKEWRRSGWRSVIGDARINSLEMSGDRLYVGTTMGLFTTDPGGIGSALEVVEGLPSEIIMSLSHDPGGLGLWVVGPDWIGRLTADGFESLATDLTFNMTPVASYLVSEADGLGGIYVGNDAGLFRFDERDGLREHRRESGCLEDGAMALLRDREGNIWTTGRRGVSKIISLRFANYDTEHGLFDNEVIAVLQRRSGEIVLGHRHGLTIMDDPKRLIDFGTRHHEVRVLDLAEDMQGNLWIAGQMMGLGRLDRRGSLQWFGPEIGLERPVNAVLVDRKGMLWIASSQALFVLDGGEFREIPLPPDPEKRRYLRKLTEGPDGTIYLSTGGEGVYVIKGDETERWFVDSPSDANSVYAVHLGEDGVDWIGTQDGLYRRDGRSFVRAVSPGPEVSRSVYFILADTDGSLWFATDNGVYRWDGERMVHFTVEDGLIGRETNRGAGLVDSGGDVWIGTEHGVSVYRDRFDRPRTAAPLVRLLGLEAGGSTYDLNGPVRLDGGPDVALFRFRAVALTDESRIEFRSRLEGFDREWLGPHAYPTQEIRYTNLPPGEYRFHLQAVARGQPWSDVVSSDTIAIPAPLWRRPWFLGLAAAAMILALVGALRVEWQRRYARRLEDELRLRLEEMRRLEADIARAQKLKALGVLAGGIAHDFNNLLTVIVGSMSMLLEDANLVGDERMLVQDTLSAADRSQALTRQLLTFARGGAPILQAGSISEVIRESSSFVLRGSSVRCDFELPDDLWMVEMDSDQISQVVGNLLLNAKQATGEGGKVLVRGRNHESAPENLPPGRYVEIGIEDYGCGIPEEHLGKIFDPYFSTKETGSGLGLATAYSIVKRHGGRLVVESTEGTGSTFKIFLRATEKRPAEEKIEAPAGTAVHTGRILVMDDEEAVRSIIGAMLRNIGYAVEFAADGDSALEIYGKAMSSGQAFDVVLMDLTIPGGMGGEQAVKQLLDLDPGAKVIVLSGYSNDPVLADYARYGFCARLSKPVTFAALRATLGRIH